MIELVRVAADVQEFCESRGWRFCFIGGVAVQFWAELRTTRDVDLTLLTGFGSERPFIDALLSRFQSRVPNPVEHAERTRVLLLQSPDGIGIDIAMGAFLRQGDASLDWRYIHEQLKPLLALKEAPELLDQLEALRAKVRKRQPFLP